MERMDDHSFAEIFYQYTREGRKEEADHTQYGDIGFEPWSQKWVKR
jgi:hypothetical protein